MRRRERLARLTEQVQDLARQQQAPTWQDRMPPADRAAAQVVVGELVEIASRAGQAPPDVSEFHWALLGVMRSRRGVRLLERWAELLMRSPPVPPELPAYDQPDNYVPAGCLPDWKTSAPIGAGNHAGAVCPPGSAGVLPVPGPPVESHLPAVPFVALPPVEPPISPSVKGIVERLASYLPRPEE
jgi:hypothetical protein